MSSVTSKDGTSIDYDRSGSGPTVVFVAGAVQHRAIDQGTSAAALELAAAGFSTVVYDRRGRGTSSDTAPWHLDREVEDLAAVLTAGDPDVNGDTIIVSSSSGAAVALAAAAALDQVSGLVLYEPPFFPGTAKSDQIATVAALVAEGRNDEAMRYNFGSVIGMPAATVDGIAGSPAWPAMCAAAPTLVYDFTALHDIATDPDWAARWSGVGVPVLVCSGSASFPGLADAADRVAAALVDARRETVPEQGHAPSPEAVVDIVTRFVRDRLRAGTGSRSRPR